MSWRQKTQRIPRPARLVLVALRAAGSIDRLVHLVRCDHLDSRGHPTRPPAHTVTRPVVRGGTSTCHLFRPSSAPQSRQPCSPSSRPCSVLPLRPAMPSRAPQGVSNPRERLPPASPFSPGIGCPRRRRTTSRSRDPRRSRAPCGRSARSTTRQCRPCSCRRVTSGGECAHAWAVRSGIGRRPSFVRSDIGGPVLSSPDDGEELQQPDELPALAWNPVSGARGYTIQISIDPNFTDPALIATHTTASTSFVLTNLGVPNVYFWRVRGDLDNAVTTEWSTARSYKILGLHLPEPWLPTTPRMNDDANVFTYVRDAVLDWEPVPGASTYALQVSTDENFNTVLETKTGITGTSYARPKTLNNDQYYWRVRPVDASGNTLDWSDVPIWKFGRNWPHQPSLEFPQHNATVGDPFYYQWTGVEHASRYVLQVSAYADFQVPTGGTPNMSCETTHTTWTPRTTSRTQCWPTAEGTYYWRVQALDEFAARRPCDRRDPRCHTCQPIPLPTRPRHDHLTGPRVHDQHSRPGLGAVAPSGPLPRRDHERRHRRSRRERRHVRTDLHAARAPRGGRVPLACRARGSRRLRGLRTAGGLAVPVHRGRRARRRGFTAGAGPRPGEHNGWYLPPLPHPALESCDGRHPLPGLDPTERDHHLRGAGRQLRLSLWRGRHLQVPRTRRLRVDGRGVGWQQADLRKPLARRVHDRPVRPRSGAPGRLDRQCLHRCRGRDRGPLQRRTAGGVPESAPDTGPALGREPRRRLLPPVPVARPGADQPGHVSRRSPQHHVGVARDAA